MADRKQFLKVPVADPELLVLLQERTGRSASEEELREQRVSFAFGNALGSESITKESVRQSSQHIRLIS
jgi:hypothetical protein